MALDYSYETVFNKKLDITEAIVRLQSYALLDVVRILSSIEACMTFSAGDELVQLHQRFFQELFTSEQKSAVRNALRRQQKDKLQPVPIFFNQLQLLNGLKLAVMHCDDSLDSSPIETGPMMEALLIINDHLTLSHVLDENFHQLNADQQREALVRYLVPNGVFNQASTPLNQLTRWYDLFFVDAPGLSYKPYYVDLLAALTHLTGVDAYKFYYIASAVFAHFFKTPGQIIEEVVPFLDLTTWWKDYVGAAEYEPVLSELCCTRTELRQHTRSKRIGSLIFSCLFRLGPSLESAIVFIASAHS